MTQRHRTTAALAAALCASALGLSACGTTVPLTSSGAPATDGLGGAATSEPVSPGAPDSGTTGGTGGSTTGGVTTGQQGTGSSTTTGGSAVPGTTGGSGTTGSVPSTTTGGGSTTQANGPIKIGILVTATSNAGAFGVSAGNTVNEQDVDNAIVNGMNAQGGMAGRRIIPVYAKTDTGSSNQAGDFAAACETFTTDNKVVAVLGYSYTFADGLEKCLAKRSIPHLSTGFNVAGKPELAAYPLFRSLDVPTIDRRGLVKLEGAFADQVVTAKSKIGIVNDNCPGTLRSLNNVLIPKMKSHGIAAPKTFTIDCTATPAAAVSALQNAELQFASSGVDVVVFHAVSEGPPLLLFAESAETQGYHPKYLVTSMGNLEALSPYLPTQQAKNVHGYGWMPSQDTPPSQYPKRNALQTRCLALLKTKGIIPTSGLDYYYAYNTCEAFFLYELAMTKTSGVTAGTGIASAIDSLGGSFTSVVNEGGALFGHSIPDAPRQARHVTFGTACKCFSYVGPSRPIPTS